MAANKYNVQPCPASGCSSTLSTSMSTEHDGPGTDYDLTDLPRYSTLEEAVAEAGVTGQNYVAYVVELRHTITQQRCNPHFLLAKRPINMPGDQELSTFADFYCTCGSSVRSGVPCRHFWAVLLSQPGALGFHLGLVNDLWFKVGQPVTSDVKVHAYFGGRCTQPLCMQFHRALFMGHGAATGDEPDVRERLGRQRQFGRLLGLAKKAVETAVDGALVDELEAALKRFLPGSDDGAGSGSVKVPAVVKGKGRPPGSTKAATSKLAVPWSGSSRSARLGGQAGESRPSMLAPESVGSAPC